MKYLSRYLTSYLIQNEGIKEEDKELYEYAFYSFFLALQPLFFAVFMGLITGEIVRCVMITLPFVVIRRFGGGYHAAGAVRCVIFSTILMSICLLLSFYYPKGREGVLLILFAGASLMFFSPIDHENKRMSKNEKREFKKITVKTILVFVGIAVFCLGVGRADLSSCISLGILLAAVLQLPCVILRKKDNA